MKLISTILMAILITLAASFNIFALSTKVANGVNYLTGGVTGDERAEMMTKRHEFSLLLKLAAKSGKYLGSSSVAIANNKGAIAFEGITDGPWLMVNLPEGAYKITATSANVSQSQSVNIGKNTHRELTMLWDVKDIQ